MSNPTSNFGWQMPTATDLVTDLPADFEVFGQAVDTDFVDLLGGTTGQILSKTSATDLDFTWIANDQGDITGVTAGNGITVTSPTGPVPTVAIDTAITVDKTTAQTLTNKTLTTPIISSISNTGTLTLPTSTDTLVGRATTDTLTNKTLTSPALTTPTISTLTTNGDLIYGTGSGALQRLGIGSASQVLSVSGGIPSWQTPAAGATLVGCAIKKTSDPSIADGVWTIISYDAEVYDTDAFHSTSVDPSRITIPSGKGGKYQVFANIIFAANTAGNRAVSLLVNGSETFRAYGARPDATSGSNYVLYTTDIYTAGDYLEIRVNQGSGGSLTAYFNGFYNYFGVNYIGA